MAIFHCYVSSPEGISFFSFWFVNFGGGTSSAQRISQNLTRLAIRRGELVQANLVRGFDILKADLSSSWSWAMGIGVG